MIISFSLSLVLVLVHRGWTFMLPTENYPDIGYQTQDLRCETSALTSAAVHQAASA